eukprot:scaffold220267_cov22-Tisochrysis_lutea.AAC.2
MAGASQAPGWAGTSNMGVRPGRSMCLPPPPPEAESPRPSTQRAARWAWRTYHPATKVGRRRPASAAACGRRRAW